MHIDAKEAAVLRALPPFPFAHLLRPSVASIALCKQQYKDGQPLALSYPRALAWDADAYDAALATAEQQINTLANDGVRELYLSVLQERRMRNKLVRAVQQGDDERVAAIGAALYGTPTLRAIKAREILDRHIAQRKERGPVRHEKRIDATLFCAVARTLLAHYDPQERIQVRLSSRSRLRLTMNATRGTGSLRVPKSLLISRARARRVLAHEIEVHALRFLRGLDSPLALLAHGTADVKRTEEGLAILRSQRVRREAALPAGFWDSYAVALLAEAGFTAAFGELVRAHKRLQPDVGSTAHKKRVWRILLRNMHGISSPGRAGLLVPRGDVYSQGVALLQDIDQPTRRALYLGRVGLNSLPHVLALLPNTEIKPPTLGIVRELTENL